MNIIRFYERWDKLNDPVFTTIRSYTPEKEAYYRELIGQEFKVATEPKYPFYPEDYIRSVFLVSMEVVNPESVETATLMKDVRLNRQVQEKWLQKLLAMDKAIMLTFAGPIDDVQRTLEVKVK